MIAALDPQRREDMYLLSYRDAAIALFGEFENRYQAEGRKLAILRQSRFLAISTIFLWRHFFELYLKKLVPRVASLSGGNVEFRSHRLHELWTDFRGMFLEIFPPEAGQLPRGFIEADELFRDLGTNDPDSQAWRYAKSMKDRPHLEKYDAINVSSFNRMCFFVLDAMDGRERDLLGEELRRKRQRGGPADTSTDT